METIPSHDIRYEPTKRELDYLLSLSDPIDALLAVFRIVLGAEQYDTSERVDPTRVQIPTRLWESLCQANMTWVNVGPSAYTERE